MSESKEVAKKPLIDQYLEHYSGQILAAFPTSVRGGIERFKRIVRTEVSKNPALLKCSPASLFGAVVQAAQLGLEPGGALRQCYLIPYKSECNLILGYAGMVSLAARAGSVRDLQPRAVFKGDVFSYSFGLEATLVHVPGEHANRTTKDDLTHVYCVAVLPDGTKKFDVMTVAEIESIRQRSPSARSDRSPWNDPRDYIPMAMKTVLRRLWKYVPASAEVQNMIGLDELADVGGSQGLGSVIDGDYTRQPDPDDTPPAPASSTVADTVARANKSFLGGAEPVAEILDRVDLAQGEKELAALEGELETHAPNDAEIAEAQRRIMAARERWK